MPLPAQRIDRGSVALEVGLTFGFQRQREHLLGGQTTEFVQTDLRPGPCFPLASLMHYPQHPAYSSRPASSGHLLLDSGRVRRLSLLADPQLLGIPRHLAVPYAEAQDGVARVTVWLAVRVVSQSNSPTDHQLVVYFEVEGVGALSRPATQELALSKVGEEFPWLQSFHLSCPASPSEGGALNVTAQISLDGVRERSLPFSIEVLPAT